MELPKSFLYRGGVGGLLLFNKKTFLLDNPTPSPLNFFCYNNKKYQFVESETLDNLEQLYYEENLDAINKLELDILKEQKVIKKDSNLDKILSKDKVIHFLMKTLDLINHENVSSNKLGKCLSEDETTNSIENVNKEDDKSIIEKLTNYHTLSDLIKNEQLFIIKNNVYRVISPRNGEPFLSMYGNTYRLDFYNALDSIEKSFQDKLLNKIKSEVGNSSLLNTLEEIKKKEDIYKNVTTDKEYENTKSGFFLCKNDTRVLNKNYYYIYFKIPKFIIQSPHDNKYYKFEECRLGLPLAYTVNKTYAGKPLILESNYEFPGIFSNNSLCTNGLHDYDLIKPSSKDVAERLINSVNIMLYGYNSDDVNPPGTPLKGNKWRKHLVTDLEEEKRHGYKFMNNLRREDDRKRSFF